VESLQADLATAGTIEDAFRKARERRDMSEHEFQDAVGKLSEENTEKERELVAIKRQKKIIADDMDEMLPKYGTISNAYVNLMTARIMAATSTQPKCKRFDRRAFSRDVLEYYGAKKEIRGMDMKYCHLTGWQDLSTVKCAHLVPKSLESDELFYLFGVRDAVLSDPRNGKPPAVT
jgi:hypothetical protein